MPFCSTCRHFGKSSASVALARSESLFVKRMDQNEDIFARYMNDEAFQQTVAAWMVGEVYKRLQKAGAEAQTT
jgi:hypothetical protein